MVPWDCCRTCMDSINLNPIFNTPENNEKLTNAIYNAAGIKIEPTDSLPHRMCATCINFINEVNKFRKKVINIQKALLKRLENNAICEMKPESEFKLENELTASIDTFDEFDDLKDYDDNLTVDNIKYAETSDDNNKDNQKEYESTVKDNVNQEAPLVNNSIIRKTKAHQKIRSKKSKVVLKNGENNVEGGKEEVECEYCHKILTSKLSMRNHYKIHTGFDFVCEHCGRKFITKRLLLMHCRAKHGYEKTDKCSYCDYRASNAEQVKIHERIHTGERPYVCKDCGAGFHRKSSYLQHVAIHLPEKTVQCDECPARFKSVTLMRIHKCRHRPPTYRYRCGVCGNNFARRRNVARHLQRVHALQPDSEHIQRDKIS